MVTPWPPAKCAEFARLWNLGESIPAMMAAIGCPTRQALCAKARRMKLPRRREAPNGFDRNGQSPSRWPGQKGGAKPPPLPLPKEQAPPPNLIVLLDLQDGDCRYPYGDPRTAAFGFCPAPALYGQPYCKAHDELCNTPGKK